MIVSFDPDQRGVLSGLWPPESACGETGAAELDAVIDMLATAIEIREHGVSGHAARVTRLALALTSEVAPELTADPELRRGFLLHDIGTVAVPDRILLKPGGLTRAEAEQLECHPIVGAELVTSTGLLSGVARDVVAFHHEQWDGHGYPWGLRADTIPLVARIFAVADAFEAMTSDRPYRNALPTGTALQRLRQGAGYEFDPELVERFQRIVDVDRGKPPRRRRRHLSVAA